MYQELLGISGMNLGLAKTQVNQAFLKIQNENVFSFQCITGGWLTPNLLGSTTGSGYGEGGYGQGGYGQGAGTTNSSFLSPGTITVTPYTTTITGDAVATAAWTAPVPYPPLLTQQQIRVPSYSLYNIIGLGNNGTVAFVTLATTGSGQTPGKYTIPVSDPSGGAGAYVSITVNTDGTVTNTPVVLTAGSGYTTPYIVFSEGGNSATFSVTLIATLTIDRPWLEPSQQNSGYLLYQAYYPAPPGFKRWDNIRDTFNDAMVDWWSYKQADLAEIDPQREIFGPSQPTYAVPYQIDNRYGSATIGQWLVEIWPHPVLQNPYTFGCQCNWPPLVNPTDNVPFPLSEELVKERAYEMISLFKEASKGDEMERGSGANWQFLAKSHHEEYVDLLRQVRNMDRNLVDLYYTRAKRGWPSGNNGFMNTNGTGNVGWFQQ